MNFNNKKFKCPHCQIFAQQEWSNPSRYKKVTKRIYNYHYLDYRKNIDGYKQGYIEKFLKFMEEKLPLSLDELFPEEISIAKCQSCNDFSIWVNKVMIYPKQLSIEKANDDMNEDIQDLYNEASLIFLDSPKGATALLRLALQKLLEQLGKTGNINKSIKELVEEG